MATTTAGIGLIALFTSAAFAQPPAAQDADRVFHLTHTETAQQIQEIATVIRAVADIRQLFVVASQKAVTVHGSDNQLRIAEWLVNELNRPASEPAPSTAPNSTPHEFRVPGAANDVVRVLYVGYARTPQEIQEVAVAVRSLADIQRLFIYNSLNAMAVRGTAEQIALAE